MKSIQILSSMYLVPPFTLTVHTTHTVIFWLPLVTVHSHLFPISFENRIRTHRAFSDPLSSQQKSNSFCQRLSTHSKNGIFSSVFFSWPWPFASASLSASVFRKPSSQHDSSEVPLAQILLMALLHGRHTFLSRKPLQMVSLFLILYFKSNSLRRTITCPQFLTIRAFESSKVGHESCHGVWGVIMFSWTRHYFSVFLFQLFNIYSALTIFNSMKLFFQKLLNASLIHRFILITFSQLTYDEVDVTDPRHENLRI